MKNKYQVIQIEFHTCTVLTSFELSGPLHVLCYLIKWKVKHNRNYQVFQGYPQWYLSQLLK